MKCMCQIFQKYYNSLRSINELKTTNNFFDFTLQPIREAFIEKINKK